ncbi:MAG: zinc-binding dehydrogenase [Anaerolineales bacterium]|nr:zinc-binding dehydrogenase [Anaerolineales bacterium]
MKRQSLFFTAPYQVEVREMAFQAPGPRELLVKTRFSAISPGSELLIYRGQAPAGLAADESIAALRGLLTFPLQYGYAAVGKVIEVGADLSHDWIGKTVFSFQPHQTHFSATPEQVLVIPHGLPPEAGVFLPNMETAVNFVMDGRPLIGERVAVFGQGIIGLLTTALLARFPLGDLITLDLYPNRRSASLEAGATQSFNPAEADALAQVRGEMGIDLACELSGSPAGLDQAIRVTGFAGRVVIGSWYGQKRASLDLGGHFHRSRIQLISSQVSSLAPSLSGRWSKTRRFDLAWEMIRQVKPEGWITHRLPFHQAAQGYAILDEHPEEVIQVLLEYT